MCCCLVACGPAEGPSDAGVDGGVDAGGPRDWPASEVPSVTEPETGIRREVSILDGVAAQGSAALEGRAKEGHAKSREGPLPPRALYI